MTYVYTVRVRRSGRSDIFAVPPEVKAALAIKRGDMLHVWIQDDLMVARRIDFSKVGEGLPVIQVMRDGG